MRMQQNLPPGAVAVTCRRASAALLVLCLVGSLPAVAAAQQSGLKAAIATMQAVKTDGTGSTAAAEAYKVAAAASADDLPTLLAALDQANPLAANWIYGSIDAIVDKANRDWTPFPQDALETFIKDASHAPRARQRAFTLLQAAAPERTQKLVAGFLTDPSPLFRRDAVAELVAAAEKAEADGADTAQVLPLYQKAFAAALEEDQVTAIAKKLVDAGETVDLPRKFGYLMEWRVIGPFDNAENAAFEQAFPPESLTLENYAGAEGMNSSVTYPGKLGDVSWKDYVSSADNGEIDLNAALANEKAAIGYGATVFTSSEEREAQLRLRIQNGFMIWLNGERVMAQPIGHTGNFFDQYTVPVKLRKGPNLILVKSVQVEPPAADPWYNAWQFCVRVCDETGTAILAPDRPATRAKEAAETKDAADK